MTGSTHDLLAHLDALNRMMDRLGLRPEPSMHNVRRLIGKRRVNPLQIPQNASPDVQAA